MTGTLLPRTSKVQGANAARLTLYCKQQAAACQCDLKIRISLGEILIARSNLLLARVARQINLLGPDLP
jgi:hypothetical protein